MTTDEQRVRAALAAAARMDGLHTPERVERALLAHLRRRKRNVVLGRVAIGGAIAATFLLGLVLTRPAPPPVPVTATREAAIPAAAPSAPIIAKAVTPRPLRRRAPIAVPAPMAAPEQSEFIPVGPWQAVEPMERGSIIRVRLPKSSLPGFGIPVSPDRWNESIPADVVLGEDGSMRAVRFVNARY